jgi:hypothetical protein
MSRRDHFFSASAQLSDDDAQALKTRGATLITFYWSGTRNRSYCSVVYAPSGAGKSFYSGVGSFIEMDSVINRVIGWPTAWHWWEVDAPLVTVLGERFSSATAFVDEAKRRLVQFIEAHPWWTYFVVSGWDIRLADCFYYAFMPPRKRHRENLILRGAETGQPTVANLNQIRREFNTFIVSRPYKVVRIETPYRILQEGVRFRDVFLHSHAQLYDFRFSDLLWNSNGIYSPLDRRPDHAISSASWLASSKLSPRLADYGSTVDKILLAHQYGIERDWSNILQFERIPLEDMSYPVSPAALSNLTSDKKSDGQLKLWAMFYAFLRKISGGATRDFDGRVVYWGSAPGFNLNLFTGSNFKVCLDCFDPRPTCIKSSSRVSTMLAFGFEQDVMPYFFADIRRDPVGEKSEKWEDMIADDNALMERQARRCTYAMTKYRKERVLENQKDVQVYGLPYLQPYLDLHSYELRLYSGLEKRVLSLSPGLLRAVPLIRSCFTNRDLAMSAFEIPFADVRSAQGGIANFVCQLLPRYSFLVSDLDCFNLPAKFAIVRQGEQRYDISAVAYLYRDSHRVVTLAQLLGFASYLSVTELNPNGGAGRFQRHHLPYSSPAFSDWFWLIKGWGYEKIQTAFTSPTVYVGYIPKALMSNGVPRSHMYASRRTFLSRLFPGRIERFVDDAAVVKTLEGMIILKISGHMLDILAATAYTHANIHHYMITLETYYEGEGGMPEGKTDWHILEDVVLAWAYYPYFCRIYKLKFNFAAYLVAGRHLGRLAKSRPLRF